MSVFNFLIASNDGVEWFDLSLTDVATAQSEGFLTFGGLVMDAARADPGVTQLSLKVTRDDGLVIVDLHFKGQVLAPKSTHPRRRS